MRIIMTILLAAGIVFGVGSAVRHRHHWAMHSHPRWNDPCHCTCTQDRAPKPAPNEQAK